MSLNARITIFIQKPVFEQENLLSVIEGTTTTSAINIVALSTSFKYTACGTKPFLIFYWGWQWCIMGTEWHSASLYSSTDMLKMKTELGFAGICAI